MSKQWLFAVPFLMLAEAARALTPIYRLLQAWVLAAKVVHTDDTPIPVQDATR